MAEEKALMHVMSGMTKDTLLSADETRVDLKKIKNKFIRAIMGSEE